MAKRYLKDADVVLLCVPADEEISDLDRSFLDVVERPVLVLRTKADLRRGSLQGGAPEEGGAPYEADEIDVSVLSGDGLDELRSALPDLAYSALLRVDSQVPVITRRRHALALEKAGAEVERFREALDQGLPPEVASTHLRSAETALEEVLGVISVEEVLDVVFREFCIGK